jgi:hypothetical protein
LIRLLFDEDLNHNILRGLLRRLPELDVTTAIEAGLRGVPDLEVLRFAATQGRLVVSHDVNTMTAACRALREGGETTRGLVLVPQSLPIGRAIDDLETIVTATDDEDWVGVVEFLPIE